MEKNLLDLTRKYKGGGRVPPYLYRGGGMVPEFEVAEPVSTAHDAMDNLMMQNDLSRMSLEDMLYGAIRNPPPRVEAPGLGLLEYAETGPLKAMGMLAKPGHVWDMLKQLNQGRRNAQAVQKTITKEIEQTNKAIDYFSKTEPGWVTSPDIKNELKALESMLDVSKKEIDKLGGFSKSILHYLDMPAAGKIAKKK